MREDARGELALAAQVVHDGQAAGFKLLAGDPGTLKRLEAELAERDTVAARGFALHHAPLEFAVLYTFRH